MPELDLSATSVDLTRAICDIPSVSGDERALADAIERAIGDLPHLEVFRDGDTIVARTNLGRAQLVDPRIDITWMWYDHEEVDAALNGLNRLSATRPDLFAGDFAILGEPSNGQV